MSFLPISVLNPLPFLIFLEYLLFSMWRLFCRFDFFHFVRIGALALCFAFCLCAYVVKFMTRNVLALLLWGFIYDHVPCG